MTQPVLCQTPTRGWVNLAYCRQINFRKIPFRMSLQLICVITWSNGDKDCFYAKDAQAIAKAWKNYTQS